MYSLKWLFDAKTEVIIFNSSNKKKVLNMKY